MKTKLLVELSTALTGDKPYLLYLPARPNLKDHILLEGVEWKVVRITYDVKDDRYLVEVERA
jgi:hypothetical protein